MVVVAYQTDNVLMAARRRISDVFDTFAHIVVSVSGGKDSTVMHHLAMDEAARRSRRVTVFFLDQEAEYQSTIDIITRMMVNPLVDPFWVQVPLMMTNATSHRATTLRAWWEGEEWVREKDPIAIHALDGHPRRFYDFFRWHEKQVPEGTCFLVGLRSRESLDRFRAVTGSPVNGRAWMTQSGGRACRAYPLFDWNTGDVWKYIADNGVAYNALYDRMMAKGTTPNKMRVSNLIHEKAFRCLADLQEFEPETYEKLLRRVDGVHAAALYSRDGSVYDARDLPSAFSSWRAYRDYLLDTTPLVEIDRFRKRFAKQPGDEATCRQQVKQVLINDFEGSVPIRVTKRDSIKALWWDRL